MVRQGSHDARRVRRGELGEDMNDDQLVRRNSGLQSAIPTFADPQAEPLMIDVPGPGLKRDYAGLLEYWQMVRRHKAAVIVATFMGGIVGFGLTLSSPRVYQAHTTLEIQGLNQE